MGTNFEAQQSRVFLHQLLDAVGCDRSFPAAPTAGAKEARQADAPSAAVIACWGDRDRRAGGAKKRH
jgi:hypothetical protein